MTPEERIEQLERVVAFLLEHAPLPQRYYGMSESDEALLTDVYEVRDQASQSRRKKSA